MPIMQRVAPLRGGRGLKHLSNASSFHMPKVAPLRGGRGLKQHEILKHTDCAPVAPLRGGRGLKLKVKPVKDVTQSSLPCVGGVD